jgi:hypothetical protein
VGGVRAPAQEAVGGETGWTVERGLRDGEVVVTGRSEETEQKR